MIACNLPSLMAGFGMNEAIRVGAWNHFMRMSLRDSCRKWLAWALWLSVAPGLYADSVRDLQNAAVTDGKAEFGYWGADPNVYKGWTTHSNRLIPVYTFGTLNAGEGIDLRSYTGPNSVYRSEDRLRKIYGRLPEHTRHPDADYLDQTNIYDLQKAALLAGRKYVFLVVFDGMDWETTRAAAIYNQRKVSYDSGRGTGTHFQEYTADGTTQYGFMCTSPHNEGTAVDVDKQTVLTPGGKIPGGYDRDLGGPNPWTRGSDVFYLIAKNEPASRKHAYTDSSCSMTSMTAGIKTYNNAVNVDAAGQQVPTIAHLAQERGYSVGAVSSVPISHATPACTYAHNVDRDDYQDLTRDMLGLKSISHPQQPLPGMDVVIGGGYGQLKQSDRNQGENFVPGNVYLTDDDLKAVDVRHGGKYVTAVRTAGVNGKERLLTAAKEAQTSKTRLLGFYGNGKYNGHLPFQTADGDYQPAKGVRGAEVYEPADLAENPTLADMTAAALLALSANSKGFWLMVEAGDVDWANHDDNIDNSIGAVNSGDAAVKVITEWVEQHSNWRESLLIVTADHGHYFHFKKAELLIPAERK
jgi:alkaline phosphatase